MGPDAVPESVVEIAARVGTDVMQALPGADWRHVGWAIFAVGAEVVLKNDVFAGRVRGTIAPRWCCAACEAVPS
jgi:hypothetical protein